MLVRFLLPTTSLPTLQPTKLLPTTSYQPVQEPKTVNLPLLNYKTNILGKLSERAMRANS